MSTQERKRTIKQLDTSVYDEPPPKKQRMNDCAINNIAKPILFTNKSEHEQFQDIIESVHQSPLPKQLNISRFISAEIAEYITGIFVLCATKQCKEYILISSDHNTQAVEYTYCNKSNQYYCKQCKLSMDSCNDCGMLEYIPDNINNGGGIGECAGCNRYFCEDCCIYPIYWDERDDDASKCVCNNCYVDTIIECDICGTQCKLYYKGNTYLEGDVGEMVKCKYKNCDQFICLICSDSHEEDCDTVYYYQSKNKHNHIQYQPIFAYF